MMAGIRSRDTRPELLLRRGLHARGFRFRLDRRDLPGIPDLVFPRRRAVLFAHGCFWHGHGCHLFKWPSSRPEFWHAKITRNAQRDREVQQSLAAEHWRVGLVWECAIKGRTRMPVDEVLNKCEAWLLSEEPQLEIAGDEARISV
jgi:DNA mismatch endonuclease (patch repair protein)